MNIKYAKGKFIDDWLAEYNSKATRANYLSWMDQFLQWANKTPEQLVEEYKAASKVDIRQWEKDTGRLVIMWYNELLKTVNSNVARAKAIVPRSFFANQCGRVRIPRSRIASAIPALNQHEFSLEDLRTMYHVADLKGKTVISVGVALGWGVGDIMKLTWFDVLPFLEKEAFTGFWYQRHKTKQPIRCHLTPEAIGDLKLWRGLNPNSKLVFHGNRKNVTRPLKSAAAKAGIKATGRICYHLLRKFFYRSLSNAITDPEHIDIMSGKTVPTDRLTYYQNNTDALREEYMRAYEKMCLTKNGNSNGTSNHSQVEELTQLVKTLVGRIETLEKEKSSKISVPVITA